ncbi:MAG: enoyl-CoA hydratase-related protein [Ferrimonas sp.]
MLLLTSFDDLSQSLFDQLQGRHHLGLQAADASEPLLHTITRFQPQLLINLSPQRLDMNTRQAVPCIRLIRHWHTLAPLSALNHTDSAIEHAYVSLVHDSAQDEAPILLQRPLVTPDHWQEEAGQLLQQWLQQQSSDSPRLGPWQAQANTIAVTTEPSSPIDWQQEPSLRIIQRINRADPRQGQLATVAGVSLHLFDAKPEYKLRHPQAGQLLAQRHGAVCISTQDGALWLRIARASRTIDQQFFNLPTALVLADKMRRVAPLLTPEPAELSDVNMVDLRFEQRDEIGYLYFDFAGGMMDADQAHRLLAAYHHACEQPVKVIVLMGGPKHWCHGFDLHRIEASNDPATESWRAANAFNDVVEAILTTEDKITVAALTGNASAGGLMLALACDYAVAREGILLNPHFNHLGLSGSAYWTYSLPKRVGTTMAKQLTESGLPINAPQALQLQLLDQCFANAHFTEQLQQYCLAIRHNNLMAQLHNKWRNRRKEEELKPLAKYRAEELVKMRREFASDSPYHALRHAMVYQTPWQTLPNYLQAFAIKPE